MFYDLNTRMVKRERERELFFCWSIGLSMVDTWSSLKLIPDFDQEHKIQRIMYHYIIVM